MAVTKNNYSPKTRTVTNYSQKVIYIMEYHGSSRPFEQSVFNLDTYMAIVDSTLGIHKHSWHGKVMSSFKAVDRLGALARANQFLEMEQLDLPILVIKNGSAHSGDLSPKRDRPLSLKTINECFTMCRYCTKDIVCLVNGRWVHSESKIAECSPRLAAPADSEQFPS